ncbi:MAG TPA: hypothetical protein PLO37_03680 [Candidatus Hydrogenedentes bacterium]|nr:hypothetical protein [Candidatus Hydrogenedentota bacterium]HPG65922.1 hypothetical protein [Candidatus Hydrogenedentota bacterium]
MAHVRTISLAKAQAFEKDDDVAGALFLQLWMTVMMFILTGAFGKS